MSFPEFQSIKQISTEHLLHNMESEYEEEEIMAIMASTLGIEHTLIFPKKSYKSIKWKLIHVTKTCV